MRSFREEFKFYKRKDRPLNLSGVVDFNKCKDYYHDYQEHIKPVRCSKSNEHWATLFGMKEPWSWEVYEFLRIPGLLFIKNPFLGSGQRYWIMRCLEYYTRKPNKLNIDAHNILSDGCDWWEFCQRELKSELGAAALEKLRWATFGYHHNWDTKEYSDSSKSIFPSDLRAFCRHLAGELNFKDFVAEAAIINFYHFGSSLSGHIDHSEINVHAPLFSFSFGQTAIFLIGGQAIGDEAIPILLESGDIIVMSGESRLCYHGVPRILPAWRQPWNLGDERPNFDNELLSKEIIQKLWDDQSWKPFGEYVDKSRINMNVRQVLLPGQNSLQER